MAVSVKNKLASGEKITNRPHVETLVKALEKGEVIDGRLSSSHYNVPQANFTVDEILAAMKIQDKNKRSTGSLAFDKKEVSNGR